MLAATEPLLNVKPSKLVPVLVMRETSPLGVPLPVACATLTFTLTLEPCVKPEVGLKVRLVVVGVKVTLFQLFTRFVTLTEPSPVARSYAMVVLYPESTPYW